MCDWVDVMWGGAAASYGSWCAVASSREWLLGGGVSLISCLLEGGGWDGLFTAAVRLVTRVEDSGDVSDG